jgi:hypothetical protein
MRKSWKYILLVSVAIWAVAFALPAMVSAADTIQVGIVLPRISHGGRYWQAGSGPLGGGKAHYQG